MKKKLFAGIVFALLLLSIYQSMADDGYENEGFGDDFGKGLGSLAIVMLVLGGGYVILRRGYVLAKKLNLTENEEYGDLIKTTYKSLRGPMMIAHLITNILATIFGALHGLSMHEYTRLTYYSGWIAVLAMVVLSVSGLFIYFKFKPFWKFRESRTFIRFLHRQWMITGILAISILLHLAVAEDD
ncbi:MAG: hypothetical protein D6732_22830 [Methanobacteriota archaeon]|nr:MAG: hypothetical protein D6732_22830 [Euryarchaeota archaeon]